MSIKPVFLNLGEIKWIEGDRLFVRQLFIELVQLGEGREVTRRRVDWDRLRAIADSAEQLDGVIGLLAGAQQRLIIVDEDTVEVAHEALLCRWKLLSQKREQEASTIKLWTKSGGLKTIFPVNKPVYDVCFSKDNHQIAFGTINSDIIIW